MKLLEQKDFPDEYPAEAVRVLNAMTFTEHASGLKIMGSSALRSQLYAGDYDGYEIVKGFSLEGLVKKFKEIIKHLQEMPQTYIGDIKCGEVPEWKVVPDTRKNFLRHSKQKIESLKGSVITSEEAKEAEKALSSYVVAKQEIKFHVVRWTPQEVLTGHKKLRDGRTYSLEEGFSSPSLTKLDVVSKVKGILTEFSVIYEFVVNGKVINPVPIKPLASLKESLEYYEITKNPYKALKRKFAIAKLKNNSKELKRLSEIINSDLGQIYKLYSDVKVVGDLMEDKKAVSLQPLKALAKGLPKALATDLKKVKGPKQLPVLRHIEDQLFQSLSKGTQLQGGSFYTPFKN
jgi:hypothetical protein